ncbi:MAG: exodeoxyribonuclease VII small subunit [Roseateles depolymerans]|uniref:Exodeoxyribonuclease 7 small subunit n=1 Tax=Roseateles depolymerans TaxID=76731 RepID=A0A2W5E287_9BURK|nr:MAG: exodeoxyribonuclease VII small subunit [Roseateles depolymerans]
MTKPTSRTKSAPTTESAEPSYEQALDELERLVAAMEGQQLPLDQLLRSYQRGAELLGLCRSRLEAVEQQVRVLDAGELKAWEGSGS